MPTTLVTGAAGFLGSHLCDTLIGRGHRVIGVDNLETGSLRNIEHLRDPETFAFRQLDIIEPYFVDEPIDFVYHLASPASPIDYLRLPLHTLKVGSYGTHHTLGLAKKHRARFLLASTSEVYGDPQVHPQPESYWGHVNPIGPRGVYDEAKRYAEALTMAYHRQQGVDTSIIRIFNSILADEQVLYDDGRELRRERADQLAARLATQALAAGFAPVCSGGGGLSTAQVELGFEYPVEHFSVPSFGDGGRMFAAAPSAFVGHPTDERCYEVRTAYGRSIRVTGHHSVFVEGPDGEPVAKPVEDLVAGEDRVAIAGRLDVPARDRRWVSMLEVVRRAELDLWQLAVERPGLGEIAWEKRRDLIGLLVSERPTGSRRADDRAWTAVTRMRKTDRVPVPALWRLGIELPGDARLFQRRSSMPLRVELTDELLWFLGLWVAEGSWYEGPNGGFITLSADEALLGRARAIAERAFGINGSLQPGSKARCAQLALHSKLLLRFMEHLGFGPGDKGLPGWILGLPLERLKWVLEGYREGDGVHSGRHFDEGVRHEFSTTSTALKDDLVVAFARFGLVPSVGRYASHRDGRTFPFWRLTLAHLSPWSPLAWDAGVEQRLQARRHGDLVWVKVREIEEVPATELVYDFSVPGVENFWAGTGVLAHNTYGPRMRAHDGRAIPTFLRQALTNRPITVFGEGRQTRSFCYVSDLIDGMIRLGESGHHDPVNIGNPDEFTLLELAEQVIEVTGSSSEIVFEALPTDDPQVRRPDTRKAQELLGWHPTVKLREGLQRTIEQSEHGHLIGLDR